MSNWDPEYREYHRQVTRAKYRIKEARRELWLLRRNRLGWHTLGQAVFIGGAWLALACVCVLLVVTCVQSLA